MKQGRPYHPQSQGQVENLNRRVKNCLRHFLLAYEECDRSREWPGLVKGIEYFINHTWHFTIQCTPYSAFHGRTGSVKMGDCSAEHEYMEEDFLFINDDGEEEFSFDPSSSSSDISLPKYHGNQQTLQMLGEVQLKQAEGKRKVFEATESTILRNKRAHIKRIKHRNYSKGQNVLFRNPNSAGLATTLNVRGKVTDRIGTDLYQVQYGDRSIVLFGCQMVSEDTVHDQHKHSPSADNKLQPSEEKLTNDFLLEKVYEFADLQRNYIVAKRKYKANTKVISIDAVAKKIGIDKSDLPTVYYSALDCAFLERVLSGAWLDSELISFFMRLLSLKNERTYSQRNTSRRIIFLPTYFYSSWIDYMSRREKPPLKRRRHKGKDVVINHPCNWIKCNPSDLSQLVIPVNINNNHWILSVVDFTKETITSYDSLNYQTHVDICENLRTLVKELYADKERRLYSTLDWKIENAKEFPCQRNGSDCGVYICKISDCILRGKCLKFKAESTELRKWLLQQIFASSRIDIVNETKFHEYKKQLDYPAGSDDSSFESGEDYLVEESQKPTFIPPFDEDAIIQPMATSFDDGEEIFQLPQKYRMAMNKKSTYEEYCRVSKPIVLPCGITFSVFRDFMLSIEQKLRDLCRHPQNVRWKTFLKCRNEKTIKDHATVWPFENKAVINEISSYVIAISEDEIKGNTVTALHTATYDLLPESMIALMMHCYNLDYNTAVQHYICRTLPESI